MMQKIIGVQFEPLKEGERNISIKLPKEVNDYLDSLTPKKNWRDYLIEFLQTEKNYEKFYSIVQKGMNEAMPTDVRVNCPKCGDSPEPVDDSLGYEIQGNCATYKGQMWSTYYLAANEFIGIVKRNKAIYLNKPLLFDLTKQFFWCFGYQKGRGVLYFDLGKLCKHILKTGFLSISELFAKSTILQNLSYINSALDEISEREIDNKLFDKEDEDFIALQRDFFEKKQLYYDRELFLKKEKAQRRPRHTRPSEKHKKPSIPQYALYFYYLQKAGIYPYFEHHPAGKIKAIEELIFKEKIDTTPKYFQIKFNFINNHQTNRIAKNQEANIKYVVENMLEDYPKAQDIAKSELIFAQNKLR